MAQVRVELAEQSYVIHVAPGLLARLGELVRAALPKAGRALVITDATVAPLYGAKACAALESVGIKADMVVVPAGEASKSLGQAGELYGKCVAAGLERSSVIIALGGGVVGDLAGFVAATYLRGIAFVQVPTTLLAQVDSSIGGKTGVDLPEGKNLVGAFHQPILVLADLDLLRSLPRREIAAGLAEVVKHGVIRDPEFLAFLERNAERILALDPEVMEHLVQVNCRIKAAVVSADAKEAGLRAILNFGHTVGHAVEAKVGYGGWLHGECVAVGMMAAAGIAGQAGVLQDAALPGRLEKLLTRFGLPTRLPSGLGLADIAPIMARDKKVEAEKIRWVLPVRTGDVVVTSAVPEEAIRLAVEGLSDTARR